MTSAGIFNSSDVHDPPDENALTTSVSGSSTTTSQHHQDQDHALQYQSQLELKDRQLRAAEGVNDFLQNQVARFFAQHEEAKREYDAFFDTQKKQQEVYEVELQQRLHVLVNSAPGGPRRAGCRLEEQNGRASSAGAITTSASSSWPTSGGSSSCNNAVKMNNDTGEQNIFQHPQHLLLAASPSGSTTAAAPTPSPLQQVSVRRNTGELRQVENILEPVGLNMRPQLARTSCVGARRGHLCENDEALRVDSSIGTNTTRATTSTARTAASCNSEEQLLGVPAASSQQVVVTRISARAEQTTGPNNTATLKTSLKRPREVEEEDDVVAAAPLILGTSSSAETKSWDEPPQQQLLGGKGKSELSLKNTTRTADEVNKDALKKFKRTLYAILDSWSVWDVTASQMFEHLRRHPGDTETSSSMKTSDSNRTTTTPQPRESCAAKGRDGNKDVAINNNDPEVNRSTSSLSTAGNNVAGENKERNLHSEKTTSSTTLVSSYQHQNFISTSGEQPAQKIMAPPGGPPGVDAANRTSSKLHEGELAEEPPAVVDLFPDVQTVIACMKTICVKNPEVFSFCEFDFERVRNEDHSCGRHEEVGNKVATSESTRISSASHCSGTPSIPRNAILKVRTG
ncbi:unnamed protein product [Amoebophrya sp. A120]|nr:unnamed protein product [Amoebophrya sp. A120]|eukprot:GSA120T00008407001.1